MLPARQEENGAAAALKSSAPTEKRGLGTLFDFDPTSSTDDDNDDDGRAGVGALPMLMPQAVELYGRPLYDVGRSLAGRITGLMTEASQLSRWEREEQSAGEVSRHVALALRNQREINLANARMASLSYAMGIATMRSTGRLREDMAKDRATVHKMEAELQDQSFTIDSLNTSVAQLESESEMYREQAGRLRGALDHNTQLLHRSLQQMRDDRNEQNRTIAQHLRLIRRLQSSKVRHDAVVDCVLGVLSLCMVNTTLVDGPLRLVLLVVPRRHLRRWLRQVFKLSTAVAMLRYLRERAMYIGWHNAVGAIVPYAREVTAVFVGGGVDEDKTCVVKEEEAAEDSVA